MNQILKDYRVLEIGNATAGPNGARLLSNMGAEIIKLEQPGKGDPGRFVGSQEGDGGYFHIQNYNKKSITLNATTLQGQFLLDRLVSKVDVLIENLAPGVVERWGLSPARVLILNPRVVFCSISGFGKTGSKTTQRAVDTTIQALVGVLDLTGEPEGPPTKIGVSVADAATAAVAASAIVAALYNRNFTGKGQYIDLAMMDVLGYMTGEWWPIYFGTGEVPTRTGNRHRLVAPHNVYPCNDGSVAITVETAGQWEAFTKLLPPETPLSPELTDMGVRAKRVAEIDEWITEWTSTKAAGEVERLCQEQGVPAMRVLEVDEIINSEHLAARGLISELARADGTAVKVINMPVKLSHTPSIARSAGPKLGAHNQEVYCGLLGLSTSELDRLARIGVI